MSRLESDAIIEIDPAAIVTLRIIFSGEIGRKELIQAERSRRIEMANSRIASARLDHGHQKHVRGATERPDNILRGNYQFKRIDRRAGVDAAQIKPAITI